MYNIINIKTYRGIASRAIHYYASVLSQEQFEVNINPLLRNDNPYVIARYIKNFHRSSYSNIKLERIITDENEAKELNIKDGTGIWEVGMETDRFNSMEELRTEAIKQLQTDLIFIPPMGIDDVDTAVYKHTAFDPPQKIGKQIQISGFRGFSPNFENLTEGSIHEVIETPKQFEGRKLLSGYWVHGVYEPALVLTNECKVITDDNKNS